MSLKAIHVSEVPSLDHFPENPSLLCSSRKANNKFVVIGHRGHGMNMSQSPDLRFSALKENSILSFNAASKSSLDFIEFDVQVNLFLSILSSVSVRRIRISIGFCFFFFKFGFRHVTAGNTTWGFN